MQSCVHSAGAVRQELLRDATTCPAAATGLAIAGLVLAQMQGLVANAVPRSCRRQFRLAASLRGRAVPQSPAALRTPVTAVPPYYRTL